MKTIFFYVKMFSFEIKSLTKKKIEIKKPELRNFFLIKRKKM